MIKRERKDTHGVALSVPISLNNTTADQLRNNLISAGNWINTKENTYEKQYKKSGTKNALDSMSDTCIFCQQKLTIATGNEDARSVEHFRPKSLYWWLAYSWDNLFSVCRKCNSNKDNDFDCFNPRITNIRTGDLVNIHILAADYQAIESPKLLHPELDEPETHLKYTLKGNIEDDSSLKGAYSIQTCQLERLDLIGKRKSVFDVFEEDVSLILFDGSKTLTQRQDEILKCYFDFQTDAQNDRCEFSGFKRYLFTHFFRDLLKEYLSLL
jgi:uncharacterized protein (TIGR02646 family)